MGDEAKGSEEGKTGEGVEQLTSKISELQNSIDERDGNIAKLQGDLERLTNMVNSPEYLTYAAGGHKSKKAEPEGDPDEMSHKELLHLIKEGQKEIVEEVIKPIRTEMEGRLKNVEYTTVQQGVHAEAVATKQEIDKEFGEGTFDKYRSSAHKISLQNPGYTVLDCMEKAILPDIKDAAKKFNAMKAKTYSGDKPGVSPSLVTKTKVSKEKAADDAWSKVGGVDEE